MFLFPLNKYLSIGLLGHVMSVNLTLCKSSEQFYKMSLLLTVFQSCNNFIFLAGILYYSFIIIIAAVIAVILDQ